MNVWKCFFFCFERWLASYRKATMILWFSDTLIKRHMIVFLLTKTSSTCVFVDLCTGISATQISPALFETFKWSNCFNMARHFRATCKKLACGDLLSCVIPLEFLWSVWNWTSLLDYCGFRLHVISCGWKGHRKTGWKYATLIFPLLFRDFWILPT